MEGKRLSGLRQTGIPLPPQDGSPLPVISMAVLVRYSRTSGAITGVWESTNDDTLRANARADDPDMGYLLLQEALEAHTLQEQYVVVGGQLITQEQQH